MYIWWQLYGERENIKLHFGMLQTLAKQQCWYCNPGYLIPRQKKQVDEDVEYRSNNMQLRWHEVLTLNVLQVRSANGVRRQRCSDLLESSLCSQWLKYVTEISDGWVIHNAHRKRTLLNGFYLISFRVWDLDGKLLTRNRSNKVYVNIQ